LSNVPGYHGPKFKESWLWPWAAAMIIIAAALWWMFGQ